MNFITKQVEKKLGVDLNGDGVIGSGYGRQRGGGGGMMNQLEKATHMDLNGDGRIGGGNYGYGHAPPHNQYGPPGYPPQYGHAPQYNQYGPPSYPPQYGPPPPCNHYGPPGYAPQYNAYAAPAPHYGGGGGRGGGGLMNQLEKVTGMDLNGDGRIGGRPQYHGRHY